MTSPPDHTRLLELIERFSDRRIVVIGDLIADEFIYGEISRISREAPVMILRFEKKELHPGGGGNAAANLAALGAQVAVIGVVGRDPAGRQLVHALSRRGVDTSGIIRRSGYHTPTKTRILAGSVHSTRQQVIRLDQEPDQGIVETLTAQVVRHLPDAARTCQAVILSDYDYGTISAGVVAAVRRLARRRGFVVTVDSRSRLAELKGFTSATPNQSEIEALCGHHIDDLPTLERVGRYWRQKLGLRALLITRGKEGMSLFENGRAAVHLPVVGSNEPVDVTGAGDTVIATYTLALASGATFLEAAHLANHAGGIVVMKRGTATVSQKELAASVIFTAAGGFHVTGSRKNSSAR